MNKILISLFLLAAITGCEKNESETSKLKTGTYSGIKTVYYLDTHFESLDTITIRFDNNTYSYSGSDALDFGKGNYLVKNNSIEFNDNEARITLYTWDWILTGMQKLRIADDSLILNQNSSYIQISCRLKKTSK